MNYQELRNELKSMNFDRKTTCFIALFLWSMLELDRLYDIKSLSYYQNESDEQEDELTIHFDDNSSLYYFIDRNYYEVLIKPYNDEINPLSEDLLFDDLQEDELIDKINLFTGTNKGVKPLYQKSLIARYFYQRDRLLNENQECFGRLAEEDKDEIVRQTMSIYCQIPLSKLNEQYLQALKELY